MRSKIILISISLFVLVSFSFSTSSIAPEGKPKKEIVIGFYNVENLFDTINDPTIKDDEFTPGTEKDWNGQRYNKKLEDLGTVISGMDINLPAIIGLCEIENETVVTDLINSSSLKKGKYKIAHKDSPDERGIDVGLIYQKKFFKPNHIEAVRVDMGEGERPTRDILYVKGKLKSGDYLHVFVNHWPSRYGGAEKSEPKRILAASVLKHKIDSLLSIDKETAILCMGDFNDYPDNKSLTETLDAGSKTANQSMINLMFDLAKTERGSYNYKEHWDFLDQIIVSPSLISGEGLSIKDASTGPKFNQEMIYTNKKTGEEKPARTYGGPNYYGGYSDHLPVATTLQY